MSYSKINQNFGFFLNLEKENIKTIRQCAENLIKLYPNDIECDLIDIHFDIEKKSSQLNILKSLIDTQLHNTFPNIEIALRIFCSFPCSNASGERSFSVLKRVKNYLRS